MPESMFFHRLDILVRLKDAVTGNPIRNVQAAFFRNQEPFRLRPTADGGWIGVDTGREDFMLGVNVRGFEKTEILVEYGILDQKFPMVEAFLVPDQNLSPRQWHN